VSTQSSDRSRFLVLLTSAVVLAKAVPSLRNPGLFAEDGSVLATKYLSGAGCEGWFEYYNGYSAVLPNVVAHAICALARPTWIPAAFVVCAVAIAVASRLALIRFVADVSGRRAVVAFAVLAMAYPIDNHALLCSLMYSQWSMLLILYVWALEMVLGRARGWWSFVAPVLIWSSPLSCVVLPLAIHALFARSRPREVRIFAGVLVAAAVSYVVFGVETGRGIALGRGVATTAMEWFSWRVVGDVLLGPSLRAWWYETSQVSVVLVSVTAASGAIAAMCLMARSALSRTRVPLLLASGVLALGVHAVVVVGRPEVLAPGGLWGNRHAFVQCMVLILWTAAWLGVRWSRSGRLHKVVLSILVFAHATAVVGSNRFFWTPSKHEARRVAEFMSRVESGAGTYKLERGDGDIAIVRED